MEVIKKMRLITGDQHLITLQHFPLQRTTLTPAGLAGESLPFTELAGSGLRLQKARVLPCQASQNQEFGVTPIRF